MEQTKKIALLICLLAISACSEGSLREKVGLERKPLDEFKVLSRPPLSVPPDFNLRPPSDGREVSGSESTISEEAKTIILGDKTKQLPVNKIVPETAEGVFLKKAGAFDSDSAAREIIRSETGDEEQKTTLEKLQEPLKKAEPLVDAEKEKQRILENKTQGKSVNEGETPTVKPRGESVLDKFF